MSSGSSRRRPIDLTRDEPATTPTKRMVPRNTSTVHPYLPQSPSPLAPRRKRKAPVDDSSPLMEKRLRVHRAHPPLSFHSVHQRALSQRFCILQRTPCGTEECPEEAFELTGSTGNIYTVHIKQQPTCNCPHALKGNQCKHVIYILSRVLQAPYELVYQLALVSTELKAIFANAPSVRPGKDGPSRKRKEVEGDCPICFCAFDTESPESIVWCQAACGQNIHQVCFETWAKTCPQDATCPLCRSKWNAVMALRVTKEKGVWRRGYVNVSDQLGINQHRDHSIYWGWGEYVYRRGRLLHQFELNYNSD